MSKARGLADLGNAYSDGALSNRNLIINGAMQVAQRGTSATGVTGSDGYKACDRWYTQTDTGTWTISQSTDAPSGFSYSLKLDCTTAGTSNGDEVGIRARLEGQNLQSLAYGTADAKDITVSFWVKSNQTGTYTVALWNANTTQERNVSKTYTINSADTWEYKTLTVAGDTSRSINNANTTDFQVLWYFGAASAFTSGTQNTSAWANLDYTTFVNSDIAGLGGSTNDYVQITGVQLEVGDTATPFEHRSYGDELARCQRYFEKFTIGDGYRPNAIAWSTGNTNVAVPFGVQKRASPTLIVQDDGQIFTGSWDDADDVVIAGTGPTVHGCTLDVKKASSYTVNYGYFIRNQIFSVDAEL